VVSTTSAWWPHAQLPPELWCPAIRAPELPVSPVCRHAPVPTAHEEVAHMASAPPTPDNLKRIVAASLIGTTIDTVEWYDNSSVQNQGLRFRLVCGLEVSTGPARVRGPLTDDARPGALLGREAVFQDRAPSRPPWSPSSSSQGRRAGSGCRRGRRSGRRATPPARWARLHRPRRSSWSAFTARSAGVGEAAPGVIQ
jgi:hypothetical protein